MPEKENSFLFYSTFLCLRHFQWGHIVSPLSVRTSVRPVRNTFGFRAISFGRIGVLD